MPYIITKTSGVNANRQCLLGHGETREEAFKDAYGPKPWSPQQAKSARAANVREVTEDELNEALWS